MRRHPGTRLPAELSVVPMAYADSGVRSDPSPNSPRHMNGTWRREYVPALDAVLMAQVLRKLSIGQSYPDMNCFC